MNKYGFSVLGLESGETVFESDAYTSYHLAKKALVEWLNSVPDSRELEDAQHLLFLGEESVKIYGDLNWKVQVELLEEDDQS